MLVSSSPEKIILDKLGIGGVSFNMCYPLIGVQCRCVPGVRRLCPMLVDLYASMGCMVSPACVRCRVRACVLVAWIPKLIPQIRSRFVGVPLHRGRESLKSLSTRYFFSPQAVLGTGTVFTRLHFGRFFLEGGMTGGGQKGI